MARLRYCARAFLAGIVGPMRLLWLALLALFLLPSAHAQQFCTMKRFASGPAPSGPLVALAAQSTARASLRVCLFHAVVKWGATAGDFYFFASSTPDCATQVFALTATYYGVPNSVQDARDSPPPGGFLQIPSSYTVCLTSTAPPTAVNTEVSYAP